jgi:hypothetical protein
VGLSTTKESVVEIKGGRYRYSYDPVAKRTTYIGPVGNSAPISEEQFLKEVRSIFDVANIEEIPPEITKLSRQSSLQHGDIFRVRMDMDMDIDEDNWMSIKKEIKEVGDEYEFTDLSGRNWRLNRVMDWDNRTEVVVLSHKDSDEVRYNPIAKVKVNEFFCTLDPVICR